MRLGSGLCSEISSMVAAAAGGVNDFVRKSSLLASLLLSAYLPPSTPATHPFSETPRPPPFDPSGAFLAFSTHAYARLAPTFSDACARFVEQAQRPTQCPISPEWHPSVPPPFLQSRSNS